MDVDNKTPRTFHLPKRHRNLGVSCLLTFVTFGALSAVGMWSSVAPERRHVAIYVVGFVVLFWSAFAGLAVWMILAYWREKLTVTGTQITRRGVLPTKQIDVESVSAVRWRCAPRSGGSLVLRTPTEKMTIYLGNFSSQERLWLIRHFRNVLPPVQDGWELFCGRIAVPLRDEREQPGKELSSEMARITRRRWDWYFGPFIVLSAVVGIGLAWGMQQPRFLVAPALPALMWIVLRMATPREGLVARRMTAMPEARRFLVFEFCWLGVALGGLVVYRIWQPPMPISLIAGATAVIVWFGVLIWRAHEADRQRRERDEVIGLAAAREWDERK